MNTLVLNQLNLGLIFISTWYREYSYPFQVFQVFQIIPSPNLEVFPFKYSPFRLESLQNPYHQAPENLKNKDMNTI